jgi:CRISPR-associated endonuclease Cas1
MPERRESGIPGHGLYFDLLPAPKRRIPVDAQFLSDLERLAWHRLRLTVAPHFHLGQKTPALIVLNALAKSVKTGPDPNPERPAIRRALHVPREPIHRLRRRPGEALTLDVLFFGAADADVQTWADTFVHYLAEYPKAHFDLTAPPTLYRHTGAELAIALPETPPHAELEFLSPLPFKRSRDAPRTHLSLDGFLALLQRRIKNLFGLEPPLPALENCDMQSTYWEYLELHHASKSQPGQTQYYNGCVGSLYFRGDIGPLLPWLRLAEAVHAGGGLALNALGYCRLHLPARPHFDSRLTQAATWLPALERVQQAHDDWADWLVPQQGAPFEPRRFCAGLAGRLTEESWQPSPSQAYTVAKQDGTRRLEKLPLEELVVHTGLLGLLRGPLDRLLEPAAMGYRPGRSVQAALDRVRELLREDYRYAVQSDIEDFFPSVDLIRLGDLLDRVLPPADERLRRIVARILRAPFVENGRLCPRSGGLAQGSPLSPLFANLYLDRFDEAMSFGEAQLVRYADDFVILTRTREQAATLLDRARRELSALGLDLGESDTAIRDVEAGFRFLGQPFGGLAEDAPLEMLAVPARKTVYITEPGCFLGQNGDALEIRREGRPVEIIPLRRISNIAVLAPASFSSGLVRKCAGFGIPLIFTLETGYHIASFTPDSRRHHGVAEAQCLHYARLASTERLALAKAFATRKIENYKPLVAARYRAGHADLLAELDRAVAAIEDAADTETIRGHEGHAARLIFKALDGFIKAPEFRFRRRGRDEPDRMNGLFNFGYYLLFTRLNTLVRGAGLNPYLGFLHDGDDDYESLVCDIEELFRAPVDRMLLSLVNLRVIQAGDFRETPKGVRLQPAAARRFLLRFEEMLHADVGGLSLLRAMEAQVDAFRRYVAEGRPLWFFRYQTQGSDRAAGRREDGHAPGAEEGAP